MKIEFKPMKKYLLSFLSVMLLSNLAISHPTADETNTGPGRRAPTVPLPVPRAAAENESLPKFDLNFPGGTPRDLVQAITKAKGKPLNAVIPEAYADLKLPPLSVKNVNVAQLFNALNLSSVRQENYITGTSFGDFAGVSQRHQYQTVTISYGFKTDGPPSEDSIWYFFCNKPPKSPDAVERPQICRFYQLSFYLEAGYKVEDITTAIETGWKMLGETNPPRISYHKDTKLLIAVGEPEQLKLIGDALQNLQSASPKIPAKVPEQNAPKSKGE